MLSFHKKLNYYFMYNTIITTTTMFSKLATILKTEGDKILTDHQEAKAEFERTGKKKEITSVREFKLPIQKINNINVKAVIRIFRNCSNGDIMINFQISTNVYLMDIDDNYQVLMLYNENCYHFVSITEYEIYLEKIYKIIPTLKMNNRTNKFTTEPDLDNEELSLLITHPNVDTICCCVCFEIGGITTCCNHNVCISCIDKIKPINDEDEEHQILCPLCREKIAMK